MLYRDNFPNFDDTDPLELFDDADAFFVGLGVGLGLSTVLWVAGIVLWWVV